MMLRSEIKMQIRLSSDCCRDKVMNQNDQSEKKN